MNLQKPLYHFCADWMFESIMKTGISKGHLMVQEKPPKFKANHQWLTMNPNFNQSWDALSTLPYDRTANRLQVNIPDNPGRYLYKWAEHGRKLAGKEIFELLSAYGDPENWFVFRGIIRPEWIVEVKKK